MRCFDPVNQLRTLFAAAGVTPRRIDGLDDCLIEGLIYAPNTDGPGVTIGA